jgi:hypothetical protein
MIVSRAGCLLLIDSSGQASMRQILKCIDGRSAHARIRIEEERNQYGSCFPAMTVS